MSKSEQTKQIKERHLILNGGKNQVILPKILGILIDFLSDIYIFVRFTDN